MKLLTQITDTSFSGLCNSIGHNVDSERTEIEFEQNVTIAERIFCVAANLSLSLGEDFEPEDRDHPGFFRFVVNHVEVFEPCVYDEHLNDYVNLTEFQKQSLNKSLIHNTRS